MSLGALVEPDLDLDEPGGYNPLDVLATLDEALERRQTPLSRYSEYYEGEQSLVYATEKWKRAFGGLFSAFADNWCGLVVDAVEERINVEGFRFGDPTGDADAWEIWQRNGMDADSELCHIDALIYGVAYAFVWYDDDDRATIDVESPEQVIVAYVPGSRRKRAAGLKRWDGGDGYVHATLYMPDFLWKFKAKASGGTYRGGGATAAGWERREERGEPWPLPNPLGVVPLVPFVNRPRILPRRHGPTEGASEIAQVIPVQDAINKTLLDMLVASEFGSFRQRWVTGMEIPVDPETGQQIEPFHSAVDRMFMAEDPAVKFGEFGQTDLGQYVRAVEMLVQHIASQTRTPPHYFYLSGTFPSGESLKAAETGLVAKARRKMRPWGESWEEVMRLCYRIEGDARADFALAETIWASPESVNEAAHIDALVKMVAGLGIPKAATWEPAGFTPQQIARFRPMLAEQAFLDAMAAAAGAPPPPRGAPPEPRPAPVPA